MLNLLLCVNLRHLPIFFSLSYLRYPFHGEANGIPLSKGSVCSAAFMRKTVEWRESRISMPLKNVASNVMLIKECQSLKTRCSLGQSALNYPCDVKVDKEDIRKPMDVGSHQMFSLYRYMSIVFFQLAAVCVVTPDLSLNVFFSIVSE